MIHTECTVSAPLEPSSNNHLPSFAKQANEAAVSNSGNFDESFRACALQQVILGQMIHLDSGNAKSCYELLGY